VLLPAGADKAMSKSEDKSPFNRRNFLKTSLAASVAASTMSAGAAWEGPPPAQMAGAETAHTSIIKVTGTKHRAGELRPLVYDPLAVQNRSILVDRPRRATYPAATSGHPARRLFCS